MLPVMPTNNLQVGVLPFSLNQVIGQLSSHSAPGRLRNSFDAFLFLSTEYPHTLGHPDLAPAACCIRWGHLECLLGRGVKVKVSGPWDTVTLALAARRASRQHT